MIKKMKGKRKIPSKSMMGRVSDWKNWASVAFTQSTLDEEEATAKIRTRDGGDFHWKRAALGQGGGSNWSAIIS